MKFSSRNIAPHADGLRVTGDLTIRGTTREVVLEVEGPSGVHADPWGNERIGASAKTKIKRSDFGMTYGVDKNVLGDEVTLMIALETIQPEKK